MAAARDQALSLDGTERRRVGRFDVMAVLDAQGPFFEGRSVAFPDATTADWQKARRVDPGAFGPEETWNLNFQCFAIRGPGDRVTLIDTGVGPVGSPASSWAPVPGRLPERLRREGIDATDVDLVIQTHLHSDHLGWSVGPEGKPVFPNARYVVQKDEVDALVGAGSPLVDLVVEPLRAHGQLHEVDGDSRLVGEPGRSQHQVRVAQTPGHTPGHQSVIAESARSRMVFTGDVVVHAVQLVNPEIGYHYEADQDLARGSREALLASAAEPSAAATLATAHLTRPFVSVD